MGLRRKNKSPAVLSHEFFIQNHADTASCLVVGLLLGLVFEDSAKYAVIFIAVQYNVTYTTGRINEEPNLSLERLSPSSYAEDIPRQLRYICLYIAHISGAYILKFTIWALLFVMVRLLTLTVSVLPFGFGLARVESQGFATADRNFSVLPVRIGCLCAVCLTQAWMMWKFTNFQLKKWREHAKNRIPKKKITNTKNKRTKKEPNRANFVNGAAKSEGGTSPRIRKSKPV